MTHQDLQRIAIKRGFVIHKIGSRHHILKKGDHFLTLSRAGSATGRDVPNTLAAIERACRNDPEPPARLKAHMIHIGRRVRALIEFENVPKGTLGSIVEDYGAGFIVQWDIPGRASHIRDGFDKGRELMFLEPA